VPTEDHIRDRPATEARLRRSVGALLSRGGFRALTAERVAREAGVDRALINRYFGNLEGLIRAYAADGEFWPSADELVGGDWRAFTSLSRADRFATAHRNFLRALAKRPLTLQILKWELVEQTQLSQALSRQRERVSEELFERLGEGAPRGELAAAAALISAGLIYLTLRAGISERFIGVPLVDDAVDELEARLMPVIRMIAAGVA
jgi:AcrR family transcriptional regulator